ncbi:hypothetical protein HY634_02550 [Candidatus Uhrbacteria bacterium]|nr:hypothetical protein [Candidatus Uhrbacteria bacterium]
MADTQDTDPGAAPAGRRESSVRTSLLDLQRIEEERIRSEEEADRIATEAADRARIEADRREREAAAARARQEETEAAERRRAEAAVAERARLLDVEQRLKDQERALRQEFELERARLIGEREQPKSGPSRIVVGLAVAIAIATTIGTVVTELRVRRIDRANVRTMEHFERLQRDIRASNDQRAVVQQHIETAERSLAEAIERASRMEAQVLELTRTSTRPHINRAPAAPKTPRPPRPASIDLDVSDDPLGDLVSPTRKR